MSVVKNKNSQIVHLLNDSTMLRFVFLLVAWLLVWQMGRLVEYTNHASVWFPAAGLTFSCLMVLGWRCIFPIMIGAILITVWQINYYAIDLSLNEQIWAGFLFGLAHIIPYWIGASFLAKLTNQTDRSVPKLIVTFLLIAGLSTLIVAVLVVYSLVYTNQLELSVVSITLLPFWIGDMAGVVILGPLFTSILIYLFPDNNVNLKEFSHGRGGFHQILYFKIALNIFLIFFTMLLAYLFNTEESAFAIFFLTVTHMWIASTESPLANILSLAISSVLIVLLVHFFDLMDYAMVYQFALNVIGANALFGIAIPQLRVANKKLKVKVYTDALTQVATRHYMEQRAELEIMQCQSGKLNLSLVVFDLDNFKQINDKYGHSAGDVALKGACDKAKEYLQAKDLIARFGGDEFVLLLPGMCQKEAFKVVEKIRIAIQQVKIGCDCLTSSFGIADVQGEESFKKLFERADKALYASKESGGNFINLAQ